MALSGDIFSQMRPMEGKGTILGCRQTFGINVPLESTVVTCKRTRQMVELTIDPGSKLPVIITQQNLDIPVIPLEGTFIPQPLNFNCENASTCPHACGERRL